MHEFTVTGCQKKPSEELIISYFNGLLVHGVTSFEDKIESSALKCIKNMNFFNNTLV